MPPFIKLFAWENKFLVLGQSEICFLPFRVVQRPSSSDGGLQGVCLSDQAHGPLGQACSQGGEDKEKFWPFPKSLPLSLSNHMWRTLSTKWFFIWEHINTPVERWDYAFWTLPRYEVQKGLWAVWKLVLHWVTHQWTFIDPCDVN